MTTIREAALEKAREVIDFLNGEGPLDGVWFGDPHPALRGSFWWRREVVPALRALALPPDNLAAQREAVEECARICNRTYGDPAWDGPYRISANACAAAIRAYGASLSPPAAVGASKPVDTDRLYSTTDGRVWAAEFAKVRPDVDEGLMIGWFANCAENAKDHARRASKPVEAADDRETVRATLRAAAAWILMRPRSVEEGPGIKRAGELLVELESTGLPSPRTAPTPSVSKVETGDAKATWLDACGPQNEGESANEYGRRCFETGRGLPPQATSAMQEAVAEVRDTELGVRVVWLPGHRCPPARGVKGELYPCKADIFHATYEPA